MKIIKPLVSICALSAAALAVGCGAEDVGSSTQETNGLHAIFEAVASGDGTTRVEAQLRVGGPNGTYLFLDGGDRLVASADGEEVDMGENSSGDRHWFLSRFETDADNTEFQIQFLRGDEDKADATESIVTIPKPFSMGIEGIDDEGDPIERGQDITVTWSNTDGGTILIDVSGSCIWDFDDEVDDSGEYTIASEDIRVQSLDEGEDCDVEITLERNRKGSVDPGYDGGEFWARQRRAFVFTSTPAPGEGEGGDGDGMGGSN